jgi:diaminohydroxyphosphoribosylaminopyrimidine deaminase / 5-amino-6-(5-phosphoribosylamino)uracil reductase
VAFRSLACLPVSLASPGSPLILSHMTELEAMRRAIQLAWGGWGRVHPNPMVGAVVLRDGQVIAEGIHGEYGQEHAEAVALRQLNGRAAGATMVVSLEPCAHQGHQPPCTKAIIQSGITRVVAAIPDPNPIAAGGFDRLKEAGVAVEVGLLRDEAESQNSAFLHRFKGLPRPFIALKLATSIDARIADRAGSSRWISGPAAREFVHWLRAGFDAIAVGGRTARVDDATLTVRGDITPRVPPARVIITRTGELSPDSRLLTTPQSGPVIIAQVGSPSLGMLDHSERAGVTVIRAEGLESLMEQLLTHGVTSMLVEGGGELAGALVAAGLVDRFYWIQSPLLLGERAIPAFQGVAAPLLASAERWRVVERLALGDDTLLVLGR